MRALPVLVVLLALAMTTAAVWQMVEAPGAVRDVRPTPLPSPPPGEPVAVTVTEGESAEDIGEALEAGGVIDSAVHFHVLVSLLGYEGALVEGEYEFERGTPALETVYRIHRGIVSARSVAVIEGWRLEQTADALAQQGVPREEFLASVQAEDYDFDFLSELPAGASVEGYLFPATYYVRRAETAAGLVRRMLEAFDANVPQELRDEAARAGLTLHEVVTLASIIEREAVIPEERPLMAQVFLTRLVRGMRLEADPTVQYALSQGPQAAEGSGYWKEELTAEDLEVRSLYNTYRYYGLPPGPIASPGLSSIEAVVRPAQTGYLYFVAKPDGSHAFAETLQEHLENVKKYRGE